MAIVHNGKDGTVLRSPALKQCNSLADLEYCARKDIFTSQSSVQGTLSESANELANHGRDVTHEHVTQETAQKNNRYPEPSSTSARTEDGRPVFRRSRSMVWKPGAHEHQGLRQKLSFLRLRLGAGEGTRETNQEETLFPFGIRGPSGEIQTMTPDEEEKLDQPRIALLRPGKTKRRVRRWAKGAKNVMRRAMRKTLDRSAHFSA